ncbi:MAG TPA: rhodanese-like domain-containing protein [Bacillota bacterium]|nr:rhodanese-like domain-containing protein [Bacillota bacterium]
MSTSTLLNILTLLIFAWFVYTRFAPTKGLKNLNADEFSNEMRKNPDKVLIDVREPGEYKSGAIPGAVNIPLSQLKNRIVEIPKDTAVFLYCRSGMRSKQAGKILSKSGFPQLAHLQGGISAYEGKLKK